MFLLFHARAAVVASRAALKWAKAIDVEGGRGYEAEHLIEA